jgi:hypothetical protein
MTIWWLYYSMKITKSCKEARNSKISQMHKKEQSFIIWKVYLNSMNKNIKDLGQIINAALQKRILILVMVFITDLQYYIDFFEQK